MQDWQTWVMIGICVLAGYLVIAHFLPGFIPQSGEVVYEYMEDQEAGYSLVIVELYPADKALEWFQTRFSDVEILAYYGDPDKKVTYIIFQERSED